MRTTKYTFNSIILGLSGCLKYDVNMQISNDKSMDFDLVIAINTSMLESLGQTTSKEFKKDEVATLGFAVSSATMILSAADVDMTNEEILNKIIVNIKHTIISKINIIIFFFKSIPFNPL